MDLRDVYKLLDDMTFVPNGTSIQPVGQPDVFGSYRRFRIHFVPSRDAHPIIRSEIVASLRHTLRHHRVDLEVAA